MDRHCKALTKAGESCKAAPLIDTDFCLAHSDAKTRESVGFVADNGKAGRPRRPREIELYQEVADEFQEQIRQALRDGLTAKRAVVVGNGPDAHTEEVDDIPTRLKTVDMIADRLHGRPRQSTEISGPEGQPIATTVITDSDIAEAARDVLRRTAATGGD